MPWLVPVKGHDEMFSAQLQAEIDRSRCKCRNTVSSGTRLETRGVDLSARTRKAAAKRLQTGTSEKGEAAALLMIAAILIAALVGLSCITVIAAVREKKRRGGGSGAVAGLSQGAGSGNGINSTWYLNI